jgi:hypothetical protein
VNEVDAYFGNNSAVGKQLLWEHTIHQVTLLFSEAEKRIRATDLSGYYSSLDGWWRSKPQKLKGKNGFKVPEETAVSEAIVEQMECVKRDFILGPRKNDPDIAGIDNLEFHAEAPRKNKVGIGRKAKPTDFRFYRAGIGGFDLRIEAKVVTKEADIKRHYLSKEGLGRFSDKREPYTDELVGGMVAYTVTDDRAHWEQRLTCGIENMTGAFSTFRHAVKPTADPVLFCKVPFNFNDIPNRNEVLVFHYVLEFDCVPSAR